MDLDRGRMARVVVGRRKPGPFLAGLVALWVCVALTPAPACAVSREVRTVLVTGLYGAGAGTVLGLTTYPITGEFRSVLMGTSVGLYLGLALGIYFISTPEDPGNPYRAGREGEPSGAYLTAMPRAAEGSAAGRTTNQPAISLRFASF